MRTLTLFILAGTSAQTLAADAAATPEAAPRGMMGSRHIAHIYYNLATGARVATLIDGLTRPATDGASSDIWISDNRYPCAGFGQEPGWPTNAGVMDDPLCTSCMTSTRTGPIYLDWGDVPTDTVVDCVGITWSTYVQDTDTDNDQIGDGVEGFAGTWVWFDADDGFNSSATRRPITGFTLTDLPGKTGTFHQYLMSTYTATIDLAGSFTSSLAFEIGDTDSNSSAPVYNPASGVDLDADGLHDFSYALTYTQPGTYDFDSDGILDGDTANQELTGWLLGMPEGQAVDNGDGTWSFQPDPLPAAQSVEDAFDYYIDADNDGEPEPVGTFFYSGFSCDRNGDGVTGDVQPYTQFYMNLYGPADVACCTADIYPPGACDGLLNIFDVTTYIDYYNAGDPPADLAAPFGTLNFFDMAAYINSFIAGCP